MRLLRYLIRIFGPNSQTIEKHLAENKTFRKAVLQSKNIIEDVMQDFVDLKQGKGKFNHGFHSKYGMKFVKITALLYLNIMFNESPFIFYSLIVFRF